MNKIDHTFLKTSRYFHMESGLDLLRSGGQVTLSWGIELITELTVGKEPRGMAFNVNGMKFQGTVVLSVNGADLYEARFYTEGKLVHTITDLYLTNVITELDEYIEKQPEYVF